MADEQIHPSSPADLHRCPVEQRTPPAVHIEQAVTEQASQVDVRPRSNRPEVHETSFESLRQADLGIAYEVSCLISVTAFLLALEAWLVRP